MSAKSAPAPVAAPAVPADTNDAANPAHTAPVRTHTEVQSLPEQYFNDSLFKEDNTGTDKLKGLLTGLKNTILDNYSDTDCLDLMPGHLARFYRDLDGNMDQLFIDTPHPSIAFIYKSLGCPYSLQPQPYTSKFVEPAIPALKSEGWIMWTTIQLLLGPEEHSGFLTRAVEKWDIRDPVTGLIYPKTLPRECFPLHPDKRMVAWYEGVSERLRKEAAEEAEERERQAALQQHAEHRRIVIRRPEDDVSVDSRGPALAYFRNPLYRHVDGRPTIVRPVKRPPLSPRHSMMDKAKNGAANVGNVIRNVANPHLWDGPSSAGSSRERERRRRSVPDNRHHHPSEPAPDVVSYDDRLPLPHARHRRQRSDRPLSSSNGSWESDERSPRHDGSHSGRSPSQYQPSLRHSRSHEPTPTQREHGDYFDPDAPAQPRRGSAFDDEGSLRPPVIGPSFGPSDQPPFVAQVARHPAPEHARRDVRPPPRRRDEPGSPYDSRRDYDRDYDRDRRGPHPARERSRPPHHEPHAPYDDAPGPRPPRERSRPSPHDARPPYDDSSRRRHDSRERRPLSRDAQRRSRSGRRSAGSDLDSGYSGPEDREGRRTGKPKQTRFAQQAVQGVDGRRYVDEAPWR